MANRKYTNENNIDTENINKCQNSLSSNSSINSRHSKTLLENDKKDKFYLFTNWYAQKLNYSLDSFSKEFQTEVFVDPLLDFQKYLSQNYEYTTTSFGIYMKNIIKT